MEPYVCYMEEEIIVPLEETITSPESDGSNFVDAMDSGTKFNYYREEPLPDIHRWENTSFSFTFNFELCYANIQYKVFQLFSFDYKSSICSQWGWQNAFYKLLQRATKTEVEKREKDLNDFANDKSSLEPAIPVSVKPRQTWQKW